MMKVRWKVVLLLSCLLALLGGLPLRAQTPSPAEQAYAEANEAYEKRENEKALAAFERAISLDPAKADYHLGRARALARLARHTESVEECQAALKLRPDDPKALRDLGHYQINLHHVAAAIPPLVRAESLDKKDRDIYYHLALAYYIQGDFRQAAGQWENCLRLAEKDDDTISCTAWLYPSLFRAGRKKEAQKTLERITPEIKPKDNTAYFDRLMLFKGAAVEDEVAKTMEKDGVSKPTVAYSIGLWHLLNGRRDRAREYFQMAAGAEINYAFGAVAAEAELKRLTRSR